LHLAEIQHILQAEVLINQTDLSMDIPKAMASDLMSDVLSFCEPGSLLLTGLINSQAVRTADVADVSAIIFVRGKKPSHETIQMAKERNIPLLTTAFSMFKACGDLYSHGMNIT